MQIPFVRSALIGCFCFSAIDAAGTLVAAQENAANQESAAESEPETPAIVYLTLLLARDSAVQAELKLKSNQAEGIRAAVAEVDEPLWRLRDVPVKNCADELGDLLARLQDRLRHDLSAAQFLRLQQLVLQARGSKALLSPEMAAELGLASDQTVTLKSFVGESIKARQLMERDNQSQSKARQAQAREKQRQAETKRLAEILTGEQVATLSSLLGKSFDLGRVTTVGCIAPELRNVETWINSKPLAIRELQGKVVVVHFWAFSCINCIRNLPHYQSWHEKFAAKDVTIIGIHTPETEGERNAESLRAQVKERGIIYPVAFDARSENWKAWGNNMWPSVYLVDKQGRVRNWWYGELNWEGAKGEEFIRQRISELIAEK